MLFLERRGYLNLYIKLIIKLNCFPIQDAQNSFSMWFDHFHHAKPNKPDTGIGGNFTERVAIEHKQREYEIELGNWQQSLMRQTEVSKYSGLSSHTDIYNI